MNEQIAQLIAALEDNSQAIRENTAALTRAPKALSEGLGRAIGQAIAQEAEDSVSALFYGGGKVYGDDSGGNLSENSSPIARAMAGESFSSKVVAEACAQFEEDSAAARERGSDDWDDGGTPAPSAPITPPVDPLGSAATSLVQGAITTVAGPHAGTAATMAGCGVSVPDLRGNVTGNIQKFVTGLVPSTPLAPLLPSVSPFGSASAFGSAVGVVRSVPGLNEGLR